MPQTPTYDLPYPNLSDTPDVPRDLQALAEAAEAAILTAAAELTTIVRRTTQPIPAGAATAVSFDTEVLDELGAWSAGAPTKLVTPSVGLYRLEYTLTVNVPSGGITCIVDPAATTGMVDSGTVAAGLGWGSSGSMTLQLAASVQLGITLLALDGGTLSPAMMALTKLR